MPTICWRFPSPPSRFSASCRPSAPRKIPSLSRTSRSRAMISSPRACGPARRWARRWRGCSATSWKTRHATPGSSCSLVSSALLYALVAALGNVAGGFAVTRRAARELALIEHFVACGAGFMLAVALVELLPEAFARSGSAAAGLVLAGYLAVHLTQHTLTPHFHFGEETHAVNRVAGTSALIGLLLHTFFDGVAIASAFLVRPALGVMVFIALFLHKLPEGVTISSLYLEGA